VPRHGWRRSRGIWRWRTLTSHEVVVQTIAATTTATDLTVQADLEGGWRIPPDVSSGGMRTSRPEIARRLVVWELDESTRRLTRRARP
jgi:hypothetical protein